jgi:hypothetical protein
MNHHGNRTYESAKGLPQQTVTTTDRIMNYELADRIEQIVKQARDKRQVDANEQDELTDDEDIEEASGEREGASGDYDLTDDETPLVKPSQRAPTTNQNIISPKSERRNPSDSTFSSNINPKPTLKSADGSSAALRPFCNALAFVLLYALAAL